MELPPAIFVGFFPKITRPAPPGLGIPGVRQVASVSTCISTGPDGWINRWQHNDFGFYDSEALAAAAAQPDFSRFDLYAYKLFPFRCLGDTVETLNLTGVEGAVPAGYHFLGYDIVTRSTGHFFECSPLSCNYAAAEYPVNEYCLIDDVETAYRVLLEISRVGMYEPGPYYLFEVYRKLEDGG